MMIEELIVGTMALGAWVILAIGILAVPPGEKATCLRVAIEVLKSSGLGALVMGGLYVCHFLVLPISDRFQHVEYLPVQLIGGGFLGQYVRFMLKCARMKRRMGS